jgi:hypothetical protein
MITVMFCMITAGRGGADDIVEDVVDYLKTA